LIGAARAAARDGGDDICRGRHLSNFPQQVGDKEVAGAIDKNLNWIDESLGGKTAIAIDIGLGGAALKGAAARNRGNDSGHPIHFPNALIFEIRDVHIVRGIDGHAVRETNLSVDSKQAIAAVADAAIACNSLDDIR